MISVCKQLLVLKLILVMVLQLTVFNVHSSSAEKSVAAQGTTIPYKRDNPGIESATSKFIIMFVVLLTVAISGYLISRKYSLNLWQKTGTVSDAAVKIMQVKRLTANSTILQISIDGKIYTILESKNNIKLINSE